MFFCCFVWGVCVALLKNQKFGCFYVFVGVFGFWLRKILSLVRKTLLRGFFVVFLFRGGFVLLFLLGCRLSFVCMRRIGLCFRGGAFFLFLGGSRFFAFFGENAFSVFFRGKIKGCFFYLFLREIGMVIIEWVILHRQYRVRMKVINGRV